MSESRGLYAAGVGHPIFCVVTKILPQYDRTGIDYFLLFPDNKRGVQNTSIERIAGDREKS
jgi:hypothetical protein